MAVGDTLVTGSGDLRAEVISKLVTGFALQSYKFKNLISQQKTRAWKNTFYVEGSSELAGGTGSAVKGIPRGANFPYGEPNWTESSARLEKYGMEGVIFWEDERTNDIDVIRRTLLRIGRAVAKAIDDQIYSVLTARIENTLTITAGNEWDSVTIANRDPIQDILNSMKLISEDNYDIFKGGNLWLNPKDYANLMGNANIRNVGQFWSESVTKDGKMERICGLNIVVSNSVDADEAMVLLPKEALTWTEVLGLRVETVIDPMIKKTVRAGEIGVCLLKNPKAGCKIANTAK